MLFPSIISDIIFEYSWEVKCHSLTNINRIQLLLHGRGNIVWNHQAVPHSSNPYCYTESIVAQDCESGTLIPNSLLDLPYRNLYTMDDMGVFYYVQHDLRVMRLSYTLAGMVKKRLCKIRDGCIGFEVNHDGTKLKFDYRSTQGVVYSEYYGRSLCHQIQSLDVWRSCTDLISWDSRDLRFTICYKTNSLVYKPTGYCIMRSVIPVEETVRNILWSPGSRSVILEYINSENRLQCFVRVQFHNPLLML